MTQCMVRPRVARGFVKLADCGLASMYPASAWSVCCAPGHHGYQRAFELISGRASNGPFGSPVFACAGKTDPPSSSHPLADLGGGRLTTYVIDKLLILLCAVPLFVPGGRSFVPALRVQSRRAQGPSRLAVAQALPLVSMLPGHALTAPSTAARITLHGTPSHRSCRTRRRVPC